MRCVFVAEEGEGEVMQVCLPPTLVRRVTETLTPEGITGIQRDPGGNT